VLAPDSGYVIGRDGSVNVVRRPAPDATAYGRGWRRGNWVAYFPSQVPALREAASADISAIMRLDVELWGENAWPRERVEAILAWLPEARHFLVAELDGRVIGYGLLQVDDGRPLVEVLGVTATQRGWGVGSALLTELLAEAGRRGHAEVFVRAREDDPRPQRLYRSYGFEQEDILANYVGPGINAVEMRLDLAAVGRGGRLDASGSVLRPHAARELGYNLAGAISRAQRELEWTLGIIGLPNLVPPPTHDVLFPVQTPERELAQWRREAEAARDLAAVAREFLLEPGQPGEPADDHLGSALKRADHAVRALPPPPASLPAAAAERAALWPDLARFRQAASDLGSAVAGVLAPPIAEWHLAFSVLSALRDQARALLARPGEQQPELAAELEQVDEAVRAVPPPPRLRPATAAELSASRRAMVTVEPRAQDFRRALVVALNRAIGAWDERVAAATRLAAAVRGLLPHTRGQRAALEARLNETLAELPAQPSLLEEAASPLGLAEDALQEFGRIVALEEAARAVLAAVAAEGPWARLTASADLERAARDVLPYTGEQQAGLTTRLDETATRLRESRTS
jgi:ribosomal-protein-alanine N-acetyltransferase